MCECECAMVLRSLVATTRELCIVKRDTGIAYASFQHYLAICSQLLTPSRPPFTSIGRLEAHLVDIRKGELIWATRSIPLY